MPSHISSRLSPRVRSLVAKLAEGQRAQLDGLEVAPSGFGEWLEAGGELLPEPAEALPTPQHLRLVDDGRH